MNEIQILEIKADLDNLGLVRDFVAASLKTSGLSSDAAGEFLLAIDEAVSNTITHGFRSDPGGRIELAVTRQPEALHVQIRDNARLFDPTQNSDPQLEISPLDRDAPGGFGIYLLHRLVDGIVYRVTDDGRNELSLLKKIGHGDDR